MSSIKLDDEVEREKKIIQFVTCIFLLHFKLYTAFLLHTSESNKTHALNTISYHVSLKT